MKLSWLMLLLLALALPAVVLASISAMQNVWIVTACLLFALAGTAAWVVYKAKQKASTCSAQQQIRKAKLTKLTKQHVKTKVAQPALQLSNSLKSSVQHSTFPNDQTGKLQVKSQPKLTNKHTKRLIARPSTSSSTLARTGAGVQKQEKQEPKQEPNQEPNQESNHQSNQESQPSKSLLLHPPRTTKTANIPKTPTAYSTLVRDAAASKEEIKYAGLKHQPTTSALAARNARSRGVVFPEPASARKNFIKFMVKSRTRQRQSQYLVPIRQEE